MQEDSTRCNVYPKNTIYGRSDVTALVSGSQVVKTHVEKAHSAATGHDPSIKYGPY